MAKNTEKGHKSREKNAKSPLTAQNRFKMGVWIFLNGQKCQNRPRNGIFMNIARFGQKVYMYIISQPLA